MKSVLLKSAALLGILALGGCAGAFPVVSIDFNNKQKKVESEDTAVIKPSLGVRTVASAGEVMFRFTGQTLTFQQGGKVCVDRPFRIESSSLLDVTIPVPIGQYEIVGTSQCEPTSLPTVILKLAVELINWPHYVGVHPDGTICPVVGNSRKRSFEKNGVVNFFGFTGDFHIEPSDARFNVSCADRAQQTDTSIFQFAVSFVGVKGAVGELLLQDLVTGQERTMRFDAAISSLIVGLNARREGGYPVELKIHKISNSKIDYTIMSHGKGWP